MKNQYLEKYDDYKRITQDTTPSRGHDGLILRHDWRRLEACNQIKNDLCILRDSYRTLRRSSDE